MRHLLVENCVPFLNISMLFLEQKWGKMRSNWSSKKINTLMVNYLIGSVYMHWIHFSRIGYCLCSDMIIIFNVNFVLNFFNPCIKHAQVFLFSFANEGKKKKEFSSFPPKIVFLFLYFFYVAKLLWKQGKHRRNCIEGEGWKKELCVLSVLFKLHWSRAT